MNLLKAITPINLAQEKDKFLQSFDYNPTFEYEWSQINKSKEYKMLKNKLIVAICDQNLPLISNLAQEYFQVDLDSYDELAQECVFKFPQTIKGQDTLNAIKQFENAFKFFNLDYKVEIKDDHGYNFRPNVKAHKIIMSKYANFQFFGVEGEVRHELVHILRYENGKFNKIKKSINYLPTEEGLASLMQDIGVNRSSSEFQHAAEYLASKVGKSGSLRNIFNFFCGIRV